MRAITIVYEDDDTTHVQYPDGTAVALEPRNPHPEARDRELILALVEALDRIEEYEPPRTHPTVRIDWADDGFQVMDGTVAVLYGIPDEGTAERAAIEYIAKLGTPGPATVARAWGGKA
jgi:hypothetical protein